MNETDRRSHSGHPLHPAGRPVLLRFEGVSFSYGPVKVLEDARFHIHQGEFIALVGPNGSGKTTVLKLLLGLEQVQRGRIELFGAGAAGLGRERLGYVPQQAGFDRAFPICVREVVRMGRLSPLSRSFAVADKAAAEDAMEQAEIAGLADRPYSGLSGGQRRRVLVARALAAKPEFLILDEPTANMDAESETRLFNTLGRLKGKTTILIVTHDTAFVSSLVDRVLCMGSREGGDYGIVQHRTETLAVPDAHTHGDGRNHAGSRVIHDESIPGDLCDDEERT
jgi:zinc transport system ATP-binding protein